MLVDKRIGRRGNEATAGITNPMDKSAALRTLGKFAEPPVKVESFALQVLSYHIREGMSTL